LQEGRENANIDAGLGFIWRISDKFAATLEGVANIKAIIPPLRRTLRDAVKRLARKRGFEVSRISDVPFGRDVWLDIARLSERRGFPVNCVFDVGANVGQTSLMVLEHFPNAEVYAFEPHPDTFEKLAAGLKGRRAQAFNIALSDKSGKAELFVYDDEDSINSLTPTATYAVRFGKTAKSISIQVSTVDEFCSSHGIGTIDVLKVDTEGCDLEVLKGAVEKFKSRKIKFVYTEFNDVFERAGRTGGALAPISAFLDPFGFRFVTSYTDYVITDGEFFSVHNALFAFNSPYSVQMSTQSC
jgi:FkbM family methyltransferase